mmetsp:Transcript_63212/g.102230  ORF Transcript_63212/g.102230 Transcript_63212/m.102230 type:complete len:203 (-) Transcript_63212:1150-1758(-)
MRRADTHVLPLGEARCTRPASTRTGLEWTQGWRSSDGSPWSAGNRANVGDCVCRVCRGSLHRCPPCCWPQHSWAKSNRDILRSTAQRCVSVPPLLGAQSSGHHQLVQHCGGHASAARGAARHETRQLCWRWRHPASCCWQLRLAYGRRGGGLHEPGQLEGVYKSSPQGCCERHGHTGRDNTDSWRRVPRQVHVAAGLTARCL